MASRKILVNFSNALPEAKIIVEYMMKTEYVLMSYKCMYICVLNHPKN